MKILVRYNDSTDETLHSTIGVTFHGILLRNPTTGQILKKFTKSYNNLIKGYGCELKTNEMHIAIKNCDEKYIALPSDLLFSQILILNENGNGSKNFLYVRHGKSKTQTQFLLQMKDTLPCTNQAKIGSTVPDTLGDHVTTTASTVTVKQSGNKAKVPVSSSSSSGTNDSSTSISSKRSTKGSTTKINRRVQIIIAGAPASGKGTQCEFIKNTYGCVHLSTGDILREAVAAQTPVGIMAKEYMDSGKLVPDDVIIGIVRSILR
jgi:Adenylate kinase